MASNNPEIMQRLVTENNNQLKMVDSKIVQHIKTLEKLRDESAFIAAKLENALSIKQHILQNIYPGNKVE